ncbi:MAG: helix-turn-helix domain-containing protein [Arthrospira sp. PLM2.Bin9]|nr:MAG: helix-turn-helix domain-containing protein [Arthrospira sp. PLM2.Bin9]
MEKERQQDLAIFESDMMSPQELLRLEHLLNQANLKLVGLDGEEIYLPESIYEILRTVIDLLVQGKRITLVPRDDYLTTQQAADLLNVSCPYLYQLLNAGKIAYTLVGTHQRIKSEDLVNYQKQRDEERHQILTELAEMSQDLGFYQADSVPTPEHR